MQDSEQVVWMDAAIKYLKLIFLMAVFHFFADFEVSAQTFKGQTDSLASGNTTFDGLRMSSAALEKFLKKNDISDKEAASLKKFYSDRDFKLAWFAEDGLTEHAQSFWNKYEQYLNYSRDSSFYDARLHETVDSLLAEEQYIGMPADNTIELLLTHQFYTFIQHAYAGEVDRKDFQWHIPKKKMAPLSLLNNLLSEATDNADWLPVSKQYLKMRDKLIDLRNRQPMEEQLVILEKHQLIRPGDSTLSIVGVKRRLFMLGDLPALDTTVIYSGESHSAVLNFQRRHGLIEDGIVGPNVVKSLNVPLKIRIEQLLINMERMRWMPEQASGTSVWVNIPEFKLHVYEDNVETLRMDIVVGKAANRTVIFSDEIENVVFSPYWNLPQSIVKNEILPAINRDRQYLDKHHMEIKGTRNGLPLIRQKPGQSNALGRVKFIFPNRYSIYLHDTPAKQLFARKKRAFSHGCIRLSKPFEFARYLLKRDTSWTDTAIRKAMRSDREKWVRLAQKVPVFIGYFTAWVDASGELNFRDDIYGHDKRMSKQMFND